MLAAVYWSLHCIQGSALLHARNTGIAVTPNPVRVLNTSSAQCGSIFLTADKCGCMLTVEDILSWSCLTEVS